MPADFLPSLKYQRILGELQREITGGAYTPGAKLPSEADLVKRFGASRITVGRAVRELRDLGLVERRAGSGTYVRRPAPTAPEPRVAGPLVFGLLIPNLGEADIFEPICRGMAEAPGATRYGLWWGHAPSVTLDLPAREEQTWQVCQQLIEQRVSGVFFAPFESARASAAANARLLAALDEAGLPVVLLDRDIPAYPRRTRHDLVGLDNRRAGHVAAEHLLRLGRRRVAFVAPPDAAATVDARIAGYREALIVDDVQTEPALVRRFDPANLEEVRVWWDTVRPEGVICAHDRLAGQLMHALHTLGLRVPEDVALVGIDDVGYASLLPVPLTTVHQPCREIGAAAVAAMLERIERPDLPARDILLEGTLVVRQSCGGQK